MRNLSNADLAHLLDQPIFHHLSAVADDLQLECYVVGGYVRDLFLERPSNDILSLIHISEPTRPY